MPPDWDIELLRLWRTYPKLGVAWRPVKRFCTRSSCARDWQARWSRCAVGHSLRSYCEKRLARSLAATKRNTAGRVRIAGPIEVSSARGLHRFDWPRTSSRAGANGVLCCTERPECMRFMCFGLGGLEHTTHDGAPPALAAQTSLRTAVLPGRPGMANALPPASANETCSGIHGLVNGVSPSFHTMASPTPSTIFVANRHDCT